MLTTIASAIGYTSSVYFGPSAQGDHPRDPGKLTGYGSSSFKDATPCNKIPPNIAAYIVQAAEFYQLPAAFIAAVMDQESKFDPKAKSEVGARGLMQLMPGTYLEFNTTTPSALKLSKDLIQARGYKFNDAILRALYKKSFEKLGSPPTEQLTNDPAIDIINAKYNTFLGSAYLRRDYDHYKNQPKYKGKEDTELLKVMLVAYNAGAGVADEFGVAGTTDPGYVKIIMDLYQRYKACQTSGSQIAPGKVSLNVLPYKQGASTCGATSVDMVTDYLRQKKGQKLVGNRQLCGVYLLSELNSGVKGIASYSETAKGESIDQTTYFKKIQNSLNKDFPVIQGVDGSHSGSDISISTHGGHYWVISGYDSTGNTTTYTVVDPATAQSYKETEATLWKHSNNQTEGKYLIYVP